MTNEEYLEIADQALINCVEKLIKIGIKNKIHPKIGCANLGFALMKGALTIFSQSAENEHGLDRIESQKVAIGVCIKCIPRIFKDVSVKSFDAEEPNETSGH